MRNFWIEFISSLAAFIIVGVLLPWGAMSLALWNPNIAEWHWAFRGMVVGFACYVGIHAFRTFDASRGMTK